MRYSSASSVSPTSISSLLAYSSSPSSRTTASFLSLSAAIYRASLLFKGELARRPSVVSRFTAGFIWSSDFGTPAPPTLSLFGQFETRLLRLRARRRAPQAEKFDREVLA